MKRGRASRTAESVAAVRAIESFKPPGERLFEDRFARRFLRPAARCLVELCRVPFLRALLHRIYERRLPGAIANAACRTRYIDDAVCAALADGFTQIVLLGAGFDSRPYRLPGIEAARVFEVDHPATQARKRRRLAGLLHSPPAHVTFVPVDFSAGGLQAAMARNGYSYAERSFFVWEGVMSYLAPAAVDATLRYVVTHSLPGSRLVFTYMHAGVHSGEQVVPGAQELRAYAQRRGEPWRFGLTPEGLRAFLGERGFTLREEIGGAGYRDRYPAVLEGLGATVMEYPRCVLAEVSG